MQEKKETRVKVPRTAIHRVILLRTFASNFSNIDFFLEISPVKDDELVMSKM